jgi:sulfite exporter TauE/SafE
MTELLAGLLLGVAGSVHCAAMCGPLVLAFRPLRTPGRAALYHATRVAVYAAAGLISGAVGYTSQAMGLGRILSIAAGIVLLLLAVRRAGLAVGVGPGQGPAVAHRLRWAGRAFADLMRILQRRAADRPVIGVIAAGAANALLPCGLVYAALAAATAFGTTASAVSFMLSFGLGTVPMLAIISALARSVPPGLRLRLRFAAPLALAALGLLLIARGTMSPAMHVHMH